MSQTVVRRRSGGGGILLPVDAAKVDWRPANFFVRLFFFIKLGVKIMISNFLK